MDQRADISIDIPLGKLARDSSRTNMSTDTLTGRIVTHVGGIVDPQANSQIYNPFPEGLDEAKIPEVVKNSWVKVQEYKLTPEKQSKIFYFENNGEWYISIDGTDISMHNESAPHNPTAGITVENDNTYFSQSAARMHARNKEQVLPTNFLWNKMANFLGGFIQLKDILQLPSTGWFCPRFNDFPGSGLYAAVWSADNREYLDVGAHDTGYVSHVSDAGYGLSVRLLAGNREVDPTQ